ncbi:MAG: enolase C-terminal domain-like protein [Candidatus Colwellbacteria bacterium]|nr:enolase C-terminal domain-like protein [Candidatus Colwellbacteria bacterium]
MVRIKDIKASKILNSRSDWTLSIEMLLGDGTPIRVSVPEGKSSGSHEAASVGVEEAINNIEKIILPAVRGFDVSDQPGLDRMLIRLDGTPNKSRLGANAILAVSMAAVRASALKAGVPLWQYIRGIARLESPRVRPRIFANVINGGLHAGNALDIQEYLIIPRTHNIRESVDIIHAVYHKLGTICNGKYGHSACLVGDEGGYAPALDNNLSPLSLIQSAAEGHAVDFGIDAAASNITMDKNKLLDLYRIMVDQFKLAYIEDPFQEDDFQSFTEMTAGYGDSAIITGDDLTVTNVNRMEEAWERKSVNGVIIKPNQVGTMTEAIEAVRRARDYGWSVIVSHRSGETNDDFIADFGVGVGADGIKIGAPSRGERVAKYNRLLEIG